MENKETDKWLNDYFSINKKDIQDNGFTRRVMQKLPEQPDRSWIVWLCACIGIVLSLILGFSTGTLQSALMQLQKIPVYYLLGAVFCFPLVGSIGWYWTSNKYI